MSSQMVLLSSEKTVSVSNSFSYEILNFMESTALKEGASTKYEFTGPIVSYTFQGTVSVKNIRGTLLLSNTIEPGYREQYHGRRGMYTAKSYDGSHAVKCVLRASLESGDFRHDCFPQRESSGTVTTEGDSHICVARVSLAELKNSIPERLLGKVHLRIKTCVVVSDKQPSSSKWFEESPKSMGVPRKAAPFLQYFQARDNTDFIIQCEGDEFPAHSLILRCVSPVFKTMLEADMVEAAEGKINVVDVGSSTVSFMMDFIYTGKFSHLEKNDLADDTLVELLHCADKYEIDDMNEHVLELMQAKLAPANAVRFASAIELYGAEEDEELLVEVLDFCKLNLLELPKGPELREFVKKHITTLF